ncbi:MAG: HEAT repeat domain-containing protein [Actinomycetota bacterium]|nr:HEAT repeat domain-containing protein [Actinomycetota bacterium]
MPPTRSQLAALTHDPPSFLTSSDEVLRRMAVTALDRSAAVTHFEFLAPLAQDDVASVRTAAAEKLGLCGSAGAPLLEILRSDPVAAVRESVATAYGELRDPSAIPWLAKVGQSDEDRQVREAAVAALGAIDDDAAIEPLLAAVAEGPPQVRRRAIAAITVYDDPRVEPAIRKAALDRNPGVREAAEMVVGRQIIAVTQHDH